MSNFFSAIGPVRAYNAYLMDTLDIEEEATDFSSVEEDDAPVEDVNVVKPQPEPASQSSTEYSSNSTTSSSPTTTSSSTPTSSSQSTSSSGSASGSGSEENSSTTNELYSQYQSQIQDIYGTSINSSKSILSAVKADISLIRKVYCNNNIFNVEETKQTLDSIMVHFYTNLSKLNSEDSLTCISKMLASLQYSKEHTDQWLKAHLVRDESNDPIADAETNKKREEYDQYFSDVISKFVLAQTKITEAQAKDLLTITSQSDINNLPSDYSNTLDRIKEILNTDNNDPTKADDILNYKNCYDSESITLNNKKIQAAISNLLNKNYAKFFNGKSSENVLGLADNIKNIANLITNGQYNLSVDSSFIINQVKDQLSAFKSTIEGFSDQDKIKAMHDFSSGLDTALNAALSKLALDLQNQNIGNNDYNTIRKEFIKEFNSIYAEISSIPDNVTKEMRELNYLSSLYTVTPNLSKDQISTIQSALTTFTSNPTEENFYEVSKTDATLEKANIDFQDEIPKELLEKFDTLSRTIGKGDAHKASDSKIGDDGVLTVPTTPGTEARKPIIEEILSIRSRSEYTSVELATVLQRELKAINTAQNLELKKAEEEYYNVGDPENNIESIKDLNKQLKDLQKEYQAALDAYTQNLYPDATITGQWSGEAVSGSLSGTVENTIDYDKIKAKYQSKIDDVRDKITEAEKYHETQISRMKSVFDQEVRELVETLSKLGVVATLTYDL